MSLDPSLVLAMGLVAACVVGIGVLLVFGARDESVTDGSGGQSVSVDAADVRTLARPEEKTSATEKLRERLVHAGLYKQDSPTFFYATQFLLAAIPILLGIGAYLSGFITIRAALGFGFITGIAGVVAPGLWLDYRKVKRQPLIRRALPDALDVITICVEAGLSLSAALVRVSKDLRSTYPILATELTIVHRQIQMGKSTGEGLRSFAERFDLEELRSLASVVQQSEKFGASIATALRVHGESLRTKRMQKAQEKAQKAAVKILFPTLLCIFPSLFVVVLGPAAYDILDLLRRTTGN